jgi:hypothetical protein
MWQGVTLSYYLNNDLITLCDKVLPVWLNLYLGIKIKVAPCHKVWLNLYLGIKIKVAPCHIVWLNLYLGIKIK